MKRWISIVALLLALAKAFAVTTPISVSQAFQFSASAKDSQTLVLHFAIKSGFYLYKNRFQITPVPANSAQLGRILLPYTNTQIKGLNGKEYVYNGTLRLAVPVLSHQGSSVNALVRYQGCSSFGYCYPPQSKVISVDMQGHYGTRVLPIAVDTAPIISKARPAVKSHNSNISILHTLKHKSLAWIMLAFLGFGILISLTPCVLPMIPILSSIIVGQQTKGPIKHTRAFILSLAYVIGMSITYAIAGLIFGYLGSNIQTALQQPWLIMVFALIFVLMSLSMFGYFDIQLPRRLQNKLHHSSDTQKPGSFIGVMLMGAIAALVMSPCVTPPLVGALSFISSKGSPLVGASALFALGFGMGVPLLIIGASSAKWLPKSGPWMDGIKNIIGVLLLAVAISLIDRIAPSWINMLLWTALAIGVSVALGAFHSADSKWAYCKKSLGIIAFIYAIALLTSFSFGNRDPLTPMSFQSQQKNDTPHFIQVKSLADVKHAIANAKGKPVILDFYASWCIACKEMDKYTFANAKVMQALKPYLLLRADVTANDAIDKQLEQHFGVIAPPTLIFFNSNGQEIPSARIVGDTPAKAFLQHLQEVNNHL